MGWFGRALVNIAPAFALRRRVAKQRMERLEQAHKRTFEAISGSRMRYDFLTTAQGPDTAIKFEIGKLRNHIRQMQYNNGFISGPIRRIVKNVVGQGIRFQARVRPDEQPKSIPKIDQRMADEWNREAERYFDRWNRQADKRLLFSFYELQGIIEGALLRDGEALVIGRISNRKNRLVSYCLDVLECDRLQTPPEEIANPMVRNGIRFDEEGVPEAYFILKEHPGEWFIQQTKKPFDFEEVPAFNPNGTRKVLHLFNPLRPEQTRGFTLFAAGLKDLQDLDRYMEAEKMAALEAACLTGIVESGNPDGFNAAFTKASDNPDQYDRIHEFAPAMVHYLNEGEKFTMHNPTRPNETFGEYVDQLIRGPANALDIPPEVFSQNWKDFNYSNARTVLLQFWATCVERQAYLKHHLCIPVWENVARAMVVKGLLPAIAFDRRTDDFLRASWIPAVYRRWVDPLKESKGRENDVVNNFDTLTDACAELGNDVDEVLEVRARELRKIKDLEERYDVKFPTSKGMQPQQVNETERSNDEPDNSIRRVK